MRKSDRQLIIGVGLFILLFDGIFVVERVPSPVVLVLLALIGLAMFLAGIFGNRL